MNIEQVEELLLQSLEHELGGVEVYEAALSCAVNAGPEEGMAEVPGADAARTSTALEARLRGVGARCQAGDAWPARGAPWSEPPWSRP